MIEHAGQNYRQLADEIGAVLQAAAESAEKMLGDAQADAARVRAEAEAELRAACEEGRRILDEARTEADMLRAEAEWQAQEILAQARRQAAERLAGSDARLAELEQAQNKVLDRLGGVSQVLADALAMLRESPAVTGPAVTGPAVTDPAVTGPATGAAGDIAYSPAAVAGGGTDADEVDAPTAKVYFVEFPPAAAVEPAAATPAAAPVAADRGVESEIVLPEPSEAGIFAGDEQTSEWRPALEIPAWWTRGGAQG